VDPLELGTAIWDNALRVASAARDGRESGAHSGQRVSHSRVPQGGARQPESIACASDRPIRRDEGTELGKRIGSAGKSRGLALEDPSGAATSPGENCGDLAAHRRKVESGFFSGAEHEVPRLSLARREKGEPVRRQPDELPGDALQEAQIPLGPVSVGDALTGGGERARRLDRHPFLQRADAPLRVFQLLQLRCRHIHEFIVWRPEELAEPCAPLLVGRKEPAEPSTRDQSETRAATHRFDTQQLEGLDFGGTANMGATARVEVDPGDLDQADVSRVAVR
jgi:hypothetical protein